MTLSLLLQASNGVPLLGLAKEGTIVFDSTKRPEFEGSRDYRAMLEAALFDLGGTIADVDRIGVDIGPGGLGVTRTAVSFCNALAFSRGLSVTALPAFELLGREGAKHSSKPIAILRKAARPHVHFGIFENAKLVHYEHCDIQIAEKHLEKQQDFYIVGNVTLADGVAPTLNAARLETMRELLNDLPKPAANTWAYPIVEDLS